jgi:hypothetical protein
MPGPVSQSYDGPQDQVPFPPRWAFPHLTDAEDHKNRDSSEPCECSCHVPEYLWDDPNP